MIKYYLSVVIIVMNMSIEKSIEITDNDDFKEFLRQYGDLYDGQTIYDIKGYEDILSIRILFKDLSKGLPERVKKCKNLKSILLYEVENMNMEKTIKELQSFNDLERFMLNNSPNQFTSFDFLCTFSQLKYVYISSSDIKKFPECLKYHKIVKVYLTNNHNLNVTDMLNHIPESVKELGLSYSFIKEFPNQILKFQELEYLGLDGNFISEIPTDVCNMENLKRISVHDVPLDRSNIEECVLNLINY